MEIKPNLQGHENIDVDHGAMRVVPAIAVAVLFGLAVMAAAIVLFFRRGIRWPGSDVSTPIPTLPTIGGGGISLAPLLLGAILLVLVGVFVLLLALFLCMCVCKCGASGIPLPGLPDLKGIAAILRGIAVAMRDAADKIEIANGIVSQARDKLTDGAIDFSVPVPHLVSAGRIPIPDEHGIPHNVEVFYPSGASDWHSVFNQDAKDKLRAFKNDTTAQTALSTISTLLRDKANTLDDQANALERL